MTKVLRGQGGFTLIEVVGSVRIVVRQIGTCPV